MILSVCVITYNHEKFIREALDSILMQNTNFDFEIVIGDDKSTDCTSWICREYATKYANISYQCYDSNEGISSNWVKTISRCQGKYIALLEGDDYWTDKYKLQKQVDFLTQNLQYSFCYHGFEIRREENAREYHNFRNKLNSEKKEIKFEDIIQTCYPQTLTVMFRNNMIDIKLLKNLNVCDRFLYQLLLIDDFRACYIEDVMGVYRIHKAQYTSEPASNSTAVIDNIIFGERLVDNLTDKEQKNLVFTHLAKRYLLFYSTFTNSLFNAYLQRCIHYYIKSLGKKERKTVKNYVTKGALLQSIIHKIIVKNEKTD